MALGGSSIANISSANVFSHTQAMTYSYTRAGTSPNFTGGIVVTPTGGHSLAVGNSVNLTFSSGDLFTPVSFSGPYTIPGNRHNS